VSPAEYEHWVDRLRTAIGCPVDWSAHAGTWGFKKTMRLYWKELPSDQQAYNELDYYDQLYAAEMLNEDELRRIEINASYWRSRTVSRYKDETLYFHRLKFNEQSGKHRPRNSESRKRIVERSVKNALFFPEFDAEFLTAGIMWCIEQQWRMIIREHPAHFYVRLRREIGASKRKPASALRFDLDYSNNTFHGHPIQHNEKPAGRAWIDELEDAPQNFEALSRDNIDEPLVYYSWMVDAPPDWPRLGQLGW
jgi:hypothetical protein